MHASNVNQLTIYVINNWVSQNMWLVAVYGNAWHNITVYTRWPMLCKRDVKFIVLVLLLVLYQMMDWDTAYLVIHREIGKYMMSNAVIMYENQKHG